MTTQDVSCSAQKSLQDIKAKKNIGSQNNPITTPHQYIGGVVVPTPAPGQKFPALETGRTQIIHKTSPSDSNTNTSSAAQRVSFQPVFSSQNQRGGSGVENMSETVANKPADGSTQKMRLSQSGILYTLNIIREPVVEYQETRGIPRNEEITFVTLVTSLCTQAYTAAITILVMLWNLMPLVDGLVYFVRFFLDKLIDIVQTPDSKDKAIKGAIFFGELTVVIFIIFMIVGLIFMPVYVLMARLFSKVFSMIAW